LATITLGGQHILPLWYVWAGTSMRLYSSTCSQRCPDLRRNPRGAAVVDTGEFGSEQLGVELRGVVAPVGESPRVGDVPADLEPIHALLAEKYQNRSKMEHDRIHAWLRLTPERSSAGICPRQTRLGHRGTMRASR
jgi:hypothetical protein